MQIAHTVSELLQQRDAYRQASAKVALVPTMGALHEAHLRLVDEARRHADRVAVSIFVNPLQFGAGEDFGSYPRTLEADAKLLSERGADLLFAPSMAEIYPNGDQHASRVIVPGLSDILCGEFRPGHFSGVATVVLKLFNLVHPHVAVFGEKDYQQLAVIRRMTRDLDVAVEVLGLPTVREGDGLAMSSRNAYLSPEERALAPQLYRRLRTVAQAATAGAALAALESEAMDGLRADGFRPDYVRVLRAADLAPPAAHDRNLVVLAAAWLGRARLLDNVSFRRPPMNASE